MIYKKFKHIGYLTTNIDWELSNSLEKMFKEGKLTVIEDTLHGEWGMKVDLYKKRKWSTHDGCREARLSMEDDKIILKLSYYNGSSLDGHRETLRWKAEFSGLNGNTIKLFSREINSRFYYSMEDLFFREEEDKKQKRIKELTLEKLKKGE